MKAILDTSAWFAYINSSDKNHGLAAKVMENELELVISFTVFEELISLIHARLGKKASFENGEILESIGIRPLKATDFREFWREFEKCQISEMSFVDCSLVALSKKLALPVFTFDTHFKKVGCSTLPNQTQT